jgi:hypothetical protein
LENLWRRPSVNLYGIGFHYQKRGTGSLSYGPVARLVTLHAFRRRAPRPPLR